MSKKSDHSQQNEVDTQPSRVKKKQQKHLAIAVIAVEYTRLGFLFIPIQSCQFTVTVVRNHPATNFKSTIPTTHVDSAGLWIENNPKRIELNTKNHFRTSTTITIIEQQKRATGKNESISK